MRATWLLHPESPGVRVLVVRNLWQRLVRPDRFATTEEVQRYWAFLDAWRDHGSC